LRIDESISTLVANCQPVDLLVVKSEMWFGSRSDDAIVLHSFWTNIYSIEFTITQRNPNLL
jgi:hypothetical protein